MKQNFGSKKYSIYREILNIYKNRSRTDKVRILCFNHLLYYLNLGLFAAMEELNYDIYICPLRSYKPADQRALLNYLLDDFKPHFVFTPGWSINLFNTEQFVNIIKEDEIPHFYWATEDPLFFNEVSMVFAPHCDYVFTTSEECNQKYADIGIPSSTMMFACNTDIFRKTAVKREYQHDIVLVANNYYWFSADKDFRRKAIEDIVIPLVNSDYDIRIWGTDWTNPEADYTINPALYGGYMDYLETPYLYSSAKIVLGLQSVNTSKTQTSCRTYEIMGCGAFHLTPYTPAYENLFKNHYHMVWSKSAQETLELVDYYLKHDDEREKIARQGQEEILAKHTYYQRIKTMEEDLISFLSQF